MPKHFITFILLCLVMACSGAGNPLQKPNKRYKAGPAKPDDKEEPFDFNTLIGMSLLAKGSLAPMTCGEYREASRLADLTSFELDGTDEEWQTQAIFLEDSTINPAEQGLRKAWIGRQESNGLLAGLLNLNKPFHVTQDEVILELGRLQLASNGDMTVDQARRLRFFQGSLWQEQVGRWQRRDDLGAYTVKGSTLEWQLVAENFANVYLKPLWWVKLRVRREGQIVDDSSAIHLLPLESNGTPHFTVRRCDAASNHKVAMTFQELRHRSVAAADADQLFGLARLAYESVQVQLGHLAMPVADISLMAFPASQKLNVGEFIGEQVGDAIYRPHHIKVTKLILKELNSGDFEPIFRRLTRQFSYAYLQWVRPNASPAELAVAATAIDQGAIDRFLTKKRWLENFHQSHLKFIRQLDVDDPEGLIERYQRLQEPFESEAAKKDYVTLTGAKVAAAGKIFNLLVKNKELAAAWSSNQPTVDKAYLNHFSEATFHQLWDGWFSSETYRGNGSPLLLQDVDADGLPLFIETDLGTDASDLDSDLDGWSDYSEYISHTAPLNTADFPRLIVADGYFGDWQELLPSKIFTHTPVSAGKCPQETEIIAYSAIGFGSHLIVGAVPKVAWEVSQIPIGWELQIFLKRLNQSFLLRAQSGEYGYQVYDKTGDSLLKEVSTPMPNGVYGVEWLIDFKQLGLEPNFSKSRAARLKLTTIFEGDDRVSCDGTKWFYPLVKKS